MKHLFAILSLLLTAGCEVLEENISRKTVPVVAPVDRVTVQAGNIDFRWMAVEYASGYELTVVSPAFATAGRVVIDTVIYADTLDRRFGCRVALIPGEYAWSVVGFNGSYKTRVEERRLTVVAEDNGVPVQTEDTEP